MKKIFLITHIIIRYLIASIFIIYSCGKILGTQFTSSPSTWEKPIGYLNGFELAWFFYGYSYKYVLFIAITQIITGVLLCFRKTFRLGLVLTIFLLTNILATDYTFAIDSAKPMVLFLTVLTAYLFLFDAKSFIKFFFESPSFLKKENFPSWILKLNFLKFIYFPVFFVSFFFFIKSLKENYNQNDLFYGVWQVENKSNIDRVYFESSNKFWFRKDNGYGYGESSFGKYTYNKETKNLILMFDQNPAVELNNDTVLFHYSFNDEQIIIKNDSIKLNLKKISRD